MSSFANFEWFTGQARRAVLLAYGEAVRFDHDFLATEHLLAGLLRDRAGEIAAMLREQAIEPADVLAEVERSLEQAPPSSSDSFCLTPRVVRALTAAVTLARAAHERNAGPAHLLRAMLADPETMTRAFLDNFGFDCERGEQILRRLALDPDRDILVHKAGLDADRTPLDPTAGELTQLFEGRWPTTDGNAADIELNISARLHHSFHALADDVRSTINSQIEIEKKESFRLQSRSLSFVSLAILIGALAVIGYVFFLAVRWRV